MVKPIIQVENFRKIYGDVVAVADISFSLQQGEIFGLLLILLALIVLAAFLPRFGW